jgi:hypothetical protein
VTAAAAGRAGSPLAAAAGPGAVGVDSPSIMITAGPARATTLWLQPDSESESNWQPLTRSQLSPKVGFGPESESTAGPVSRAEGV